MHKLKMEKKPLGKSLPVSMFLKEKAANEEREKTKQIERLIEAKVDQALRCLLR